MLRIGLAEFFLNRAQLLAQVELALILLHLALDVGLDLVAQFDHFQFLGKQHREPAHALGRVALFEQRLTVGGIQPHRRSDEVRQEIGVGDVVDFHLHLARRLRQEADQLREETGEVAVHGDEFVALPRVVGEFDNRRGHERRSLAEALDAENRIAADDAANRAVGHFDHALNRADRTDATQVVGLGILDVLILERDQADGAAVTQRFLDQRDPGLLDDGQRDDGVREKDGVLERQDAEDVGLLFGGRTGGHQTGTLLTIMRISVRL